MVAKGHGVGNGRDLDAAWRKPKLDSFIARKESDLEDLQAES